MAVYLLNVRFHTGNQFFGLVGVELEDACHFDFHQLENIFFGHFADKCGVVRCQTLINVFAGSIHILGLFEFLVLVDALFNEYFFQ